MTPDEPHSRFSHDAAVFQYQKLNRDQTAIRQRMFEVVNFVNMVSHLPFFESWENFQCRAEWMFPFSWTVCDAPPRPTSL